MKPVFLFLARFTCAEVTSFADYIAESLKLVPVIGIR
jgi:hypothetical protein